MGKKLAIKGHATRGKEVIELLEMMGGTNPFSKNDGMVIGNKTTNCYYISEDTASKYISWDYIGPEEIDKYEIFTLEEFLEEYPHKVGDNVVDGYGNSLTIKSMGWLDDLETMVYDFEDAVIVLAAEDIRFAYDEDDDTEPTAEPPKMKNVLAELLEHIKITPKDELEREFEEIKEWSNVGPTVEEFRTFCECVNDMNGAGLRIKNMNMNIEFDLTKYSYEVKNGKLVVSEKMPVYPKTFKECRAILNCMEGNMSGYKASLFASLQDLLICRDAYWKIAGEEIGLGKTWKPDWTSGKPFYCISVSGNIIGKGKWYTDNKILAFPTEEMRDAFFENFKDLIEECKELL